MFLINTEKCYSIYDYEKFTTAEGKIFLYKLFNNDNDIEIYLKGLYIGDNLKLYNLCYDLDKMFDYNMIEFKRFDSDKSLANQASSGKIMLYFESLVLTEEMTEALKKSK